MNDLFMTLGIEAWKPLVGALLLPPVPLLVLILVGARLMFRRRILAWLIILSSVILLWLSSTHAAGGALTHWLTRPPAVLMESDIGELKRAPRTAIVVLGSGRRPLAPEYGISTLNPRSMERLRFGLWLGRETALPVAFSGGVGYGAAPGPTEAEIAARIAEREFGRPLRWTESESRDTRENAIRTVALLREQGIERIVVVTHDYHMRRAMRNFERAAEGSKIKLVAAPMGVNRESYHRLGDWLPYHAGLEATRVALHEWLGYIGGA